MPRTVPEPARATVLTYDAVTAIDIEEFIDGRSVDYSSIVYLVLATLVLVCDGFDLGAIGFIAPELVRGWHVAPSQLAPVFSAGIIGMLVGAPLLGYLGDRNGRKRAIVAGVALTGALTLASMTATSLSGLTVLRFLTGVGLGGLIPNIIALTSEVAPKRLRGMFIALVNFGMVIGLALPGLIGAIVVPLYGWPALFLVGGALPLALTPFVITFVPESMKYLARGGSRQAELLRQARLVRPDLVLGPGTSFTTGTEERALGDSVGLFGPGTRLITLSLWVALAANQMVNFFVLSWLPILLQSAGSGTAHASVTASVFALGGLAGGLAITLVVDKVGIIPLIVLFVVGVPAVAATGAVDTDPARFTLAVGVAGFCITGINFGINATLGIIYPTAVRARATGLAQAVGRLGSFAAPVVGGFLLAAHIPTRELLLVPATTLGFGAVACALLVTTCFRRLRGFKLDEIPALPRPKSGLVASPPVAASTQGERPGQRV